VDGAAVIARWKFAQQDFDPDTAAEGPGQRWTRTDLTGEEPVEREMVEIHGTGGRAALLTADGQMYAVVGLNAHAAPPYLDPFTPDGGGTETLDTLELHAADGPEHVPRFRRDIAFQAAEHFMSEYAMEYSDREDWMDSLGIPTDGDGGGQDE